MTKLGVGINKEGSKGDKHSSRCIDPCGSLNCIALFAILCWLLPRQPFAAMLTSAN